MRDERKNSLHSANAFCTESEAAGTEVSHFYKWFECKELTIQWGYKPRLNEVKPPADVTDFQRKFI